MPRRNRNALRGGTRPSLDGQPVTAGEFESLDHLLKGAWTDFVVEMDAATDSAAALASVYAKVGATKAGRR